MAAVNVSAAVASPESASATVNVVVPHPVATGVAGELNVNSGSTSVMVPEVSRGELSANMNVIAVGASVTGLASTSLLLCTAGVGAVT